MTDVNNNEFFFFCISYKFSHLVMQFFDVLNDLNLLCCYLLYKKKNKHVFAIMFYRAPCIFNVILGYVSRTCIYVGGIVNILLEECVIDDARIENKISNC